MIFEDFNNLPDFITDEIFRYLTFKDVCSSLLVCKKWHEYIGSNSICMNKICLKIEGWQDIEIITNVLTNNQRNYSSLVLNNCNPQKEFQYLKTQKWKNVKIQQMRFISPVKLKEYLSQFGEDLEVLEIERVVIYGDESPENPLFLPRIKEIVLKQVPPTAFQIFSRYSTVKKLHFDIPAFGTNKRSLIVNFFENFLNANIESLSICRNSLYGMSKEEISSIESIIISIAGSLKRLELIDWGCCHTLERLWNKLQVSHFSIHFCSQEPRVDDLRGLLPNHHLTILEISLLTDIPNIEWCRKLFLLVPYLKHLYITKIRKEIVFYAAHHLNKLETFSYVSCVIDIGKTEINTTDDDDDIEIIEMDENPGSSYDYIGKDELFDISGNAPMPLVIERYSDCNLNKSFAKSYYLNIKSESSINRHIKFHKSFVK